MRAVLIACLLLLTGGCGSDPLDVKGSLTLNGSGNEIHWLALDDTDGQPCEGDLGYSDVTAGADVVVRNSKGDEVGLGELGTGKAHDGACVFRFTVRDVKGSGNIFSVEIGHRGEVSFKRPEAGSVALTLG